ncbi:hypothetical protein OIU77_002124 [Salix suchowensis]|uniref:DUF4219 domain-containing protein n=1 Tax=Salix suchowensis TaxID=1278906 RepID=A0ABQ9B5Y1_9ROSI|nr:hypothetical protein OIU77_002124 [Salix suchowensis]
MTTNISPTSIVVEVLRDDNYDDWSACMKSYMLAHDLWDLIEPADHQEGDQEVDSQPIDHREVDSEPIDHREGDSKAWRKKNAAALHAIQVSCSPHILSTIRSIIPAKDAWDTLANSQQQHSPSHEVQSVESDLSESSQGSGAVSNEMNSTLQALYRYAHRGDWDATKDYLNQYPDAIKAKIEPYGETALHVAARAGNLKVVEELVNLMSKEDLEIKDDEGNTALSSAATVGITKMAECLVRKNQNLVTFVNELKRSPLDEACLSNNKDMARYLYNVTPVEFLRQDNGIHGSNFLQCAIGAQMLDIAYDFLHRYPNMTTTMDDADKWNALFALSKMPEIFPSGNRPGLWQQWIYSCIRLPPIDTPDQICCIYMPDQRLSGSENITLRVSSKLHGFAINLLTFLGIKKIYDLKKMHIYSNKIIRCMCEHISKLDYEKLLEANIHGAFQRAVKEGIVEFIIELIKVCPHLMTTGDDNIRNLFMSSIAYRHEKVFSLLYGLEASIATIVSLKDSSENTLLHLAAKLSPPSQLARISSAALQMQRERQWYKVSFLHLTFFFKKK